MSPPSAPQSRNGRRILHSSPSMTSLASSLSSLSLYTTTSSRTQLGPGALAGKVILSLGKTVIRGAERIVIAKRMTVIREHLPCTGERFVEGTDTLFMDGIFDDLVELSRPDLYPQSVRVPAMELILTQIASEHTTYLINCLSSWHIEDLVLLITEVISVSLFCHSGFIDPALSKSYLSALPQNTPQTLPVIAFITELARQNATTYEAAILSKGLELILMAAHQNHFRMNPTVKRAFTVLSAPPLDVKDLWSMTIEQYWSFSYPPMLEDLLQHIDTTAASTWLLLEAHFLQKELPAMLQLISPQKYQMHSRSAADTNYPKLKDFNLCQVDPVFRLQDLYESGFAASSSLWHLFRCIALGGDVYTLMTEYLLGLSHKHKVSIFSRMIYWLIPDTLEANSDKMRSLLLLLAGRPHLNAILTQSLLDLGNHDPSIKYALTDAVITLVVPILNTEFIRSWMIYEDIFRRCHYFPSFKSRPSYCKETMMLFNIVREGRLASVLDHSARERIAEALEPIFTG
ncbi:hypothetical protein R3P38DRAFT_2827454 [Favolaschia claudopus]|uniref:Uncharacterized protein n=1 Tax=Favolaschia claudopus TaxID=2862362 RepID=A0AAW0EL03_9AGAR